MPQFAHLHCHTQFSLLDGAANISSMLKKAHANGMKGVAITDHGNMFGAFQFVAEANKYNGELKPIVGCEFYLVEDRHRKTFSKDIRDKRYHQLFLAKNPEGYQNLLKMCSLGYIEGLYGKYPRIDKELVIQYHKGLIATTCCIGAEVPQTILRKGEDEARKVFEWWFDIFGEDYYIELQRHDMPEQDKVNEVLMKFARDYQVKVIASNDSHYVEQADANAHDILLCINTGEKQSTPPIREFVEEGTISRSGRFAFWNDQFYFKTQEEMGALFHDLPQALDNTLEIVDKCDHLKLKNDILLPNFPVPPEFENGDDYLRHLTMEGARKRYGDALTPEIEERLEFELRTIRMMGFAGYFLIVADFIRAGRELGVLVGPGRGSAAGSVVAYCIGITNIDPIKYQLLFERFLNPDRKSMPDIDTDFDDEGRQKVIDYVVDKYGKQQVAHIVTYSSMAAKMSIKDVARALDLPLAQSNELAKLVPDKPGITLKRVMTAPLDHDENSLAVKEGLDKDALEGCRRLRNILVDETLESRVLEEALKLEGSVRGTGIHAAGIIIAPKDLTEIIPVCAAKDVNLLITQYEGSVIEDAGVIKMDFLGLKTLTIIRDALVMIRQNHGIEIDIDAIPLDDVKTYELYQRGETNGTFQFESPGMQKYLRELKPDKFDDLIAMNALYRPGPLEYIPNFIARKHGKEDIRYDLPEMEEYLKDTYGITVYQEQVMLLSQKLAGFSKGDADVLRKAMGKKQLEVLAKMKGKFMEGASAKGHQAQVLEKIWTDWEKFAQYAFNKSHSTCYAFVAYQTAYLKAHYPAEYMSAVLTHNLSNIDKIRAFLEECNRMGMPVLPPSVNESHKNFAVNSRGQIRFGMQAIKGVGEGVVDAIIKEREKGGPFTSIFDLTRRVEQGYLKKNALEALAYSGAFDCWEGVHRAVYFAPVNPREPGTVLERALQYGNKYQQELNSNQGSLFGGGGNTESQAATMEPKFPETEEWSVARMLNYEKDVVGLYLSGHPLDYFKAELKFLNVTQIAEIHKRPQQELRVAGLVTQVYLKESKAGNRYGTFEITDQTGAIPFSLFTENFLKYSHFMVMNQMVLVRGRYEQRKDRPGEHEFRVSEVTMLDPERIAAQLRRIVIRVPIANIASEKVDQMVNLFQKNKGTCAVEFRFEEPGIAPVTCISRSVLISPTREVLEQLETFGLSYSLS